MIHFPLFKALTPRKPNVIKGLSLRFTTAETAPMETPMSQRELMFVEAEARIQSAAAYARLCATKHGTNAPETKAAAARTLRFIGIYRQVREG
jgi:hypothetical protein